MSKTLNKILLAVLALCAVALLICFFQIRHLNQRAQMQADQLARQELALTAIRKQTVADAVADSVANPGLYQQVPALTELKRNRQTIKAAVGKLQPVVAPIVALYKGEPFPYDSGVAMTHQQSAYIARVASRSRTVELSVGARLPDVQPPEFIPTQREIRRGKWTAFVGGVAVGVVAAVALIR